MESLTIEVSALEPNIELEVDSARPRKATIYVEGEEVDTATLGSSFWKKGRLRLGEAVRRGIIKKYGGLPPRDVELRDDQVQRYRDFKTRSEASRAYDYGARCANEVYGDETIRDRILKGGDLELLTRHREPFIEGVSETLGAAKEAIRPQVEEAVDMLQQSS